MAAKDDSMAPSVSGPAAIASSGQPAESPSLTTQMTTGSSTQMRVPDEMLPESGQAAASSKFPFALAGGAIILFMVIGGVIAVQRGKQTA